MLCIFFVIDKDLLNFLSFELERARSYNYLAIESDLNYYLRMCQIFNVKNLHRKCEDVQEERYTWKPLLSTH